MKIVFQFAMLNNQRVILVSDYACALGRRDFGRPNYSAKQHVQLRLGGP